MARKIINNKYQGETGLSSRTKINDNFEELYSNIVPKVFDTIEELTDYALNNPTAYAGQQCSVKADKSVLYIINNDKSLTKVGGGLIIVDTIVERNAIDTKYREIGLKVFVKETTTTYLLKYGITNNYWEEDGLFERESKGKSVIINFTVYSIDITEENVYFFWSTPTTDYCFWVDENGQRPPIVEGRTLIKFTDAQNNILPDDIAQANPFTGAAEIINLSEGECKSPFSAETFAPYIYGDVIFDANTEERLYIKPINSQKIQQRHIYKLEKTLSNKQDIVVSGSSYINQEIKKTDVIWVDGCVKVTLDVIVPNYPYIGVTNAKCFVKLSSGITELPIQVLIPPLNPTPLNSTFFQLYDYVYIRDTTGFLNEILDFIQLYIYVEFKSELNNRVSTNITKPFIKRQNVIITDPSEDHAYDWVEPSFLYKYPDYSGVIHKTVDDTFTNNKPLHKLSIGYYAYEKEADLIICSLTNQISGVLNADNTLTEYPAYGNDYRDSYVNKTTSDILVVVAHGGNIPMEINHGLNSDTEFFDNLVAVSAGSTINGAPYWRTTYGRGVEFYESTHISETQDWLTNPNNTNSYIIMDGKHVYPESQSQATPMVAAKLKKIKDNTNATWYEVRLAARATASLNGVWNKYMGFGIIDVDAAISYINLREADLSKRLADNLYFKYNISNRIKYEDIYETSPLPKKLIQEKLSTKVDLENGKVISSQIPSNILLNDGSTQMAVTLTYTPIGTVYEAEGDFSTINVNSGKICFNWDVRSSISVGDYLKLYSSTLTDIYYVQINQIDYISEYFVILNYLNIPNFKSNVINRAVKVIRNEVSYTPVEDLDLATKEYVDTKSATYTNSTPVQQALGGISVGETFENISVVKMFDKLLYPYQSPAFLTFSLYNGITILECGINWSGTTNATFTFTNSPNIKPDTLSIYQDITSLISNQSVVSPKSITLITISKTVDGQYITMKVQAENTNNILFNRSYNVTWYMPYYFGVGEAGIDVTTIQSLSKTVTSKANITRAYNTNNQVPYLAYPISRGLLTSILDKNGYETISDFTRTERTFIINGISVQYYVYEFNNPSTANNLQITYKY